MSWVIEDDVKPSAGRWVIEDAPAQGEGKGDSGGVTAGDYARSLAGGLPGAIMLTGKALSSPEGRAQMADVLVGGPLRGAMSIGNTTLGAKAWLEDQLFKAVRDKRLSDLVTPQPAPFGEAHRERKAKQEEFLREHFDPDSLPFKVGEIGTQVAGTLGVGPVLAGGARALPFTSPVWQAFANALASGGFTTRAQGLSRLADLGVRTAGGAVTGGAMAGLVNPEAAGEGAAIGAVLPGAVQGMAAVLNKSGQVLRNVRTPAPARAAAEIAEMAGVNPRDSGAMAELSAALRQQGPTIIPGSPTVPQILQTPGTSQLQRTVRTVQPRAFVENEAAREIARRSVLERIAPAGNVREVADDVGNRITDYALPLRQKETQRVSNMFEGVDPFNEVQVNLPIDEMKAAREKFLGRGVFGQGKDASAAIRTAEDIGTIELPAVKQATQSARKQPQTLLQAIRKHGGLNLNSAGGMNQEIAEFGRRQAGTTGLVSRNGKTIDRMAELMHERGFISSPDPSDLLDAMRANLSGRPVYAADVAEDSFRAGIERAMGDAPGAEKVAKPVTWREVQNLRSSLNDKWDEAQRFNRTREAAALKKMIDSIDERVELVASGRGTTAEAFPPDVAQNWSEAIAAHAAKKQRFDTGPQAAMFRRGGDNLPAVQGGEVPRRFFNANASQVQDAKGFRQLVQDDPALIQDLRRYAVSDAAGQVDRLGNLTSSKFNKWLEARAGATGQVFTQQQQAWLRAIADDLRRADVAESLGRVSGSDTMQKAASMLRLGVLDSPATGFLAGKLPGGNALLGMARDSARTSRADRLGQMLVNPEDMARYLDVFVATQRPGASGFLAGMQRPSMGYQAAPVVLTNR